MNKAPSLEELMASLRPVDDIDPKAGRTTAEWSALWHTSTQRTRDVIRSAITNGRMESVEVFRPCVMRPGRRIKTNIFKVLGE